MCKYNIITKNNSHFIYIPQQYQQQQYIQHLYPRKNISLITMNKYITIVALINGMIGGLILVLPILTMYCGTIQSLLIMLITGFFSFYSCYLCIQHLGKHTDLDKAILQHFNQSKVMKIFYDVLVFGNLLFCLMLYFNLIVTQWKGLLPYNLANPICNAVGLVVLVLMLNYFHFGAKLLGYGIISIIGYCIFLIWLISTVPQGNNIIPQFGSGGVNLAASMGGAFSIQAFFIPVLRQFNDQTKYKKYTLIAYIIGGSVYIFIAFVGAFGILNRHAYVADGQRPQTIQDYFLHGQWQVNVVEVIYLIHLYSAYGQFLLICKKRLFNVFSIKQSKHGQLLNPKQIIFVLILISFTVGIYFGNVSISTIIQINGALLGFFFIYLLPAAMHFKCLYIDGNKGKNIIKFNINKSLEQAFHNLEQNSINNTMDGNNIVMDTTARDTRMIQLTETKRSTEQSYNQYQNKQDQDWKQGKKQQNRQLQTRHDKSYPIIISMTNKQQHTELNEQHQQQTIPQHTINKPTNNLNSNINNTNTQANDKDNTATNPIQQKLQITHINTCQCKKPKFLYQIIDILFLIGMVALGAFIMVQGFISVVTGVQV